MTKPRAWIGPEGQLMLDEIYEAFSRHYPEKVKGFVPLYELPCRYPECVNDNEDERCVRLLMGECDGPDYKGKKIE